MFDKEPVREAASRDSVVEAPRVISAASPQNQAALREARLEPDDAIGLTGVAVSRETTQIEGALRTRALASFGWHLCPIP